MAKTPNQDISGQVGQGAGELKQMFLKPPNSLDEEREIQQIGPKSVTSKLVYKLDEERAIQKKTSKKYQVGWPESKNLRSRGSRPTILA